MADKLGDMLGRFKGAGKGMGTGASLLALAGAAAYGIQQSLFTGIQLFKYKLGILQVVSDTCLLISV